MTQLAAGDPHCPAGGAALATAGGTAYVCNASPGSGSGPQIQPVIADASTRSSVNAWAGLPPEQSWTLCYKATRDNVNTGFIAYGGGVHFHAGCDNRGATFFVAKTEDGHVFGGYTAISWKGGSEDCTPRTDPNAFLFSMTHSFKHEQTGIVTDYSILDCGSDGPTFGGGNDFYTNLSTEANVNLGWSYACRPPLELASPECQADFAGGSRPIMVELEVYFAQ